MVYSVQFDDPFTIDPSGLALHYKSIELTAHGVLIGNSTDIAYMSYRDLSGTGYLNDHPQDCSTEYIRGDDDTHTHHDSGDILRRFHFEYGIPLRFLEPENNPKTYDTYGNYCSILRKSCNPYSTDLKNYD